MNKAAHQPDELLRRDVPKGALRPAWDYQPSRKAVELWFESCISRGALDRALQESGFRKVSSAAGAGGPSDCVTVRALQTPDQGVSLPDTVRFQASEEGGDSCLEGFTPALLAGDELGSYFHPTDGVGAPQRAALGARG